MNRYGQAYRRSGIALDIVLAIAIFAVGLFLNLQELVQSLFDKNGLFQAWIILPVMLLVLYGPRYMVNAGTSVVTFLTTVFLFILSVHLGLQIYSYGIVTGSLAFIAYGLWIGLFIWMQYSKFTIALRLVELIFIWFAVLHMCVIFTEYYFGEGFFKTVTLGDNIVRNYGIATSVSIMAMQLAIGALLAMKFYFQTKKGIRKLLILAIFGLLVIALFLVSVRGPAAYLLLMIMFVGFARLGNQSGSRLQIVFLMIFGISFIGYYFVSNDVFTEFFLSAFNSADEGNQGRLDKYSLAVQLIVGDWWVWLIGVGSAELTQIPESFGAIEQTLESSALKGLVELGFIGMFPITLLLISIVYGLVKCWRYPIVRQNVELFAILGLLVLQCLTHETFKTWIGSFYFSLSLGVCTRILVEAGFFKAPERIVLERSRPQ